MSARFSAPVATHAAESSTIGEQPAMDAKKAELDIVSRSTLTCPHCGFAKEELMPTDACQYFYECTRCGRLLRPKKGHCCVFCSYGSAKCPPIQQERSCC